MAEKRCEACPFEVFLDALAERVAAKLAKGGACGDEWLKPKDAAIILGWHPKTLAKRWRSLPFCHPVPGSSRGFRVSRTELDRHMRRPYR